jgi:hypothetical protein
MINSIIQKSIEEASQVVGKTWPLFFVTSNPLSGYEGMPFEKQLIRHENYLMRMFFQNPRYSVKHGKRVKLMKIYF